jgi:hypothetical protein
VQALARYGQLHLATLTSPKAPLPSITSVISMSFGANIHSVGVYTAASICNLLYMHDDDDDYYYYSRFSNAKKHVVIKIIITIIIRHTQTKQRKNRQSKCTENSITGSI